MQRWHKISVAGLTVALAIATGHLMQVTTPPGHPALDRPQRMATATDAPGGTPAPKGPELPVDLSAAEITPLAATDGAPASLPEGAGRPDTPATPDLPQPLRTATLSIGDSDVDETAAAQRRTTGPDCAPSLSASAAPRAMVKLTLMAPCDPGTRVVIRHAGLAVTELTSRDGRLVTSLPALEAEASVEVAVPGHRDLRATVQVPEVDSYTRVGIQWQGEDSFQLHAYEFGANFGESGHVSAVQARDPQTTAGGFLSLLGNEDVEWPLLAQVYSYNSAEATRDGTVTIELEAPINAATCGRDMLAEAIRTEPGSGVELVDLRLPMPDCGAADGFLVLKNMLPDLNIASN